MCVIALVALLLPLSPATATTLQGKGPIHEKVKVPPQAGTEPRANDAPAADDKQTGKDKPKPNDQSKPGNEAKPEDQSKDQSKDQSNAKSKDEAGGKSNGSDDGAAKVGVQVIDGESASRAAVAPVQPAAAVQPSVTVGATTGSEAGKLGNQGTKRPAGARSKRKKRGASAGSTQQRSSAPLAVAVAAPRVRATSTTSRARKPERHRPARRSVVERIVDRVPAAYRFGLLAAIALAAGFALATLRQGRRARRAEAEALVDPLTGLANRRAFDRRLAEEWKRSERYGRPLGLVMLDLDGFKQLNDTRGHKEGDRILRQAASLIADRLRTIDVVARLGGDEFAALCPETASEGLEALTQSLQQCLDDLPVGASIGFAERGPRDESPLDLLSRADEAMYRDKKRHHRQRDVVRT